MGVGVASSSSGSAASRPEQRVLRCVKLALLDGTCCCCPPASFPAHAACLLLPPQRLPPSPTLFFNAEALIASSSSSSYSPPPPSLSPFSPLRPRPRRRPPPPSLLPPRVAARTSQASKHTAALVSCPARGTSFNTLARPLRRRCCCCCSSCCRSSPNTPPLLLSPPLLRSTRQSPHRRRLLLPPRHRSSRHHIACARAHSSRSPSHPINPSRRWLRSVASWSLSVTVPAERPVCSCKCRSPCFQLHLCVVLTTCQQCLLQGYLPRGSSLPLPIPYLHSRVTSADTRASTPSTAAHHTPLAMPPC